jgi:hypothetical protein
MANAKITQLTELTAPIATDIIPIVDDPGGSPETKKVTLANILALVSTSDWKVAGTFTYSSADAPTYVVTVASGAASIYAVGMRIKLTDSTVKYFIITAVADTALTLYGGTDYTLSGGAITLPYYSSVKAPLGFPLSPTTWTVSLLSTNHDRKDNPTSATWYNATSITLPIGAWDGFYSFVFHMNRTSDGDMDGKITLSTANNSESDANLTVEDYSTGAASDVRNTGHMVYRRFFLTPAAKTVYYFNVYTVTAGNAITTIGMNGTKVPSVVRAVCAYL